MSAAPVAVALTDGERIVWRQAAPVGSLIGERIVGIVFCAAFGACGLVALYSIYVALKADPRADVLLPWILGIVFSLIGIPGLIYSLIDLPTAWSTQYVLTNLRLIIQTGSRTQSYRAAVFKQHNVTARNGRGVIAFALGPMGRRGTGYHGRMSGVEAPQRVAALIVSTLREAKVRTPPHDAAITNRDHAGDPVTPLLTPGERVVWRQAAPPLMLALRKLLLLLPIGFLSMGAIMPAHTVLITPHPGLGMIAFMGVFVLIFGGLSLLLAAAVIRDAVSGWSTVYTLTDQRLFIASRTKLQILTPAAFAQIDRSGDVIHIMQDMAENERGVRVTLAGVAEAARVEGLIFATAPPRP